MIEGINITKKFGNNILFNNLNFKINDGEFVCFSGPSGKGKTTLLNMIGMIEDCDEGKILVDGREYTNSFEKRKYFLDKVGFIFQNFALMENKTVKQNLKIVKKKSRTSYSIEDSLNRVGMSDKVNHKIYTLSGGEQQRVALERLFLKKCDIILADEPTGSLDTENARKIMEIIMGFKEEGKTIVLVTHDPKIRIMADRVISL